MSGPGRHVATRYTPDALAARGFSGFITVDNLRADRSQIPPTPGVYVFLWPEANEPTFVARGTGGHFKMRDPNVPITTLEAKWVPESPVLYIGKAGRGGGLGPSLRTRLGHYLDFGSGKPVGHWGGRYIWQISDAGDLSVAWVELPEADPRAFESEMINEFRSISGRLPFANLVH